MSLHFLFHLVVIRVVDQVAQFQGVLFASSIGFPVVFEFDFNNTLYRTQMTLLNKVGWDLLY